MLAYTPTASTALFASTTISDHTPTLYRPLPISAFPCASLVLSTTRPYKLEATSYKLHSPVLASVRSTNVPNVFVFGERSEQCLDRVRGQFSPSVPQSTQPSKPKQTLNLTHAPKPSILAHPR